jgi:hypothetical protein
MSLEVLTITISFVSAIAAAAAAVYAGRALERADAANKIAEASLRFQVLVPALTEYRSPEMYIAIRHLWDFAKQDPRTLADRFKTQRDFDNKIISELERDLAPAYVKTTLDYHRRQVSQFYALLTSIHDEGGHQRKWLYTYWRQRELRIIPEILIPLERALAEAIDAPAPTVTIDRLNRLFSDCPT